MFSGLVGHLGTVVLRRSVAQGAELSILAPLGPVQIGESISISGCCLTLARYSEDRLLFELSAETLERTTLGRLDVGGAVNIERSLKLGDALGGHLVTGHVDAIATVVELRELGETRQVHFRHAVYLADFIAPQGSVCLDGVSLTVNDVENDSFSVTLIPHTRKVTTLGDLRLGSEVNLEVDLIARYVARQLALRKLRTGSSP